MLIHHRAAAAVCVVGAAALAVVGVRSMSQTSTAGASLAWAPLQGAPGTSAGPTAAAGSLPVPEASPSPPAASGALGGLRLPLSALFTQLNQETRNSAVGQYSILQDIGNAIREQVVRFLNWISGGR